MLLEDMASRPPGGWLCSVWCHVFTLCPDIHNVMIMLAAIFLSVTLRIRDREVKQMSQHQGGRTAV